jgi:hypothetical protein
VIGITYLKILSVKNNFKIGFGTLRIIRIRIPSPNFCDDLKTGLRFNVPLSRRYLPGLHLTYKSLSFYSATGLQLFSPKVPVRLVQIKEFPCTERMDPDPPDL